MRYARGQILGNLALKYEKALAIELIAVTDAIALVDGMIKEGIKPVASDGVAPASLALTRSRRT